MNSKRFFFVMLAVLILLGGGIVAAVYFGNSLLERQSNKLLSLKLDSEVADKQQASLTLAKKDIKDFSTLKDQADAIVPQDKDQAEAVREIVNIAGKNKISLGSVTFPASNLGIAAATGTSSSVAPKAPTVTQVQPVVGIVGVYVMPITVQSDSNNKVPYSSFISFLQDLEQNRRTAQVSSVSITPDKQNNNNLTFTLVLNVYIKP